MVWLNQENPNLCIFVSKTKVTIDHDRDILRDQQIVYVEEALDVV